MKETDLNIKYICDKTLLNEDDELISIILDMIKESYKSGLCQAEYDNTMGLIEENEKIKLELSGYRQAILSNKEMLGLKEENEELKKQVEQYKSSQSCSFVNICKNVKIANYIQQKEFINYLNSYIYLLNDKPDMLEETQKDILEEILQKYKEIINKNS